MWYYEWINHDCWHRMSCFLFKAQWYLYFSLIAMVSASRSSQEVATWSLNFPPGGHWESKKQCFQNTFYFSWITNLVPFPRLPLSLFSLYPNSAHFLWTQGLAEVLWSYVHGSKSLAFPCTGWVTMDLPWASESRYHVLLHTSGAQETYYFMCL